MSGPGQVQDFREFVRILKVLENPVRLRMIAELHEKPRHIYALAKALGMSYPLAHLYLSKLERLGLVEGHLIEEGGRTQKVYRVADFLIQIDPQTIRELVRKSKEAG